MDTGLANIGVAALESLGKLIHAHVSPIQFAGKAMTVEALALRVALERTIRNNWKDVRILLEAKSVIDYDSGKS